MTIPTLIQNYKERAWSTAAEVFERKLEKATKVMNTQMTLIGYSTTKYFINELSNHIKIVKTCDSDNLTECFTEKFYWGAENTEVDTTDLTSSENLGKEDYETELIGVMFANGVNAIMTYNKHCTTQDPYSNQINTTGCIAMVYDVDGFTKPNTFSKDIRSFNGVNISTIPGGCDYYAVDLCMTTAFSPDPVTVFGSYDEYINAAKEVYEGYKPYTENENHSLESWKYDRWAAARKTCLDKGMDLPSKEQMLALARYIYDDKSLSGLSNDVTFNERNASKTPIKVDNEYWQSNFLGIATSIPIINAYLSSYNKNSFYLNSQTDNAAASIDAFCVK